jgi:Fic family protein
MKGYVIMKKTKREMFNEIRNAVVNNKDFVAFIDHEIELLDKKSKSKSGQTKTQKANEGIKNNILDGMEVGKRYTVTDLIKNIDAIADFSNQKISALVNQLVKAELVKKIEEKRKTYFVKVEV